MTTVTVERFYRP